MSQLRERVTGDALGALRRELQQPRSRAQT